MRPSIEVGARRGSAVRVLPCTFPGTRRHGGSCLDEIRAGCGIPQRSISVFVQECVCPRLMPIRLGSTFGSFFDGSPRGSARLDSASGQCFKSRLREGGTTRLACRGKSTPALFIITGRFGHIWVLNLAARKSQPWQRCQTIRCLNRLFVPTFGDTSVFACLREQFAPCWLLLMIMVRLCEPGI